jgi:hypothetical protein
MAIWTQIKSEVCKNTRENDTYEAYLTMQPVAFAKDRYWVIGHYESMREPFGLTRLAGDLRSVAAAQNSFSKAWFGRFDDRSPQGNVQPAAGGYKWALNGDPNLPGLTPTQIAGLRKDRSQTARKREQYSVFRDYWQKTTLGAHHIVEKSILGTLEYNTGALDDNIAPCVLVSPELHKLFSDKIATHRNKFKDLKNDIDKAVQELTKMYTDLYARAEMADLLKIAKIIIDHVKCKDLS